MNPSEASPETSPEVRRRRRERAGVLVVLALVVFFGFLEGWFFRFKSDLPLLGNILLFALININVILLLLLVYLVLRNIVKLVFERKLNILGSQLRTRLVIAFVGLALIPTIPLFMLATRFISFSLDYWFSQEVEKSLELAVDLGKDYLEEEKEQMALDARLVRSQWKGLHRSQPDGPKRIEAALDLLLERYHLDAVFLFKGDGETVWLPEALHLSETDLGWLRSFSLGKEGDLDRIRSVSLEHQKEVLVAWVPVGPGGSSAPGREDRLVLLRLLPFRLTQKMYAITLGYENYLQLDLLRNPLKTSHFIIFSIVTLLVIFAAIWFGFLLARNITVPVQNLVAATRRIADGDLEVRLSSERRDEIGMLITSFNQMVEDLGESRRQLASAYQALQQSLQELEERRRYMEIVLENIAAGVVSVDADGKIMTMNKSAEAMFDIQADRVMGKSYTEVLRADHLEVVKSFMEKYEESRQVHLERRVRVMVANRPMVLLIKMSVLRDDEGCYLGAVVVFDDLTELEKAQRMAAWREVARRIAHEIKNPLTPIQLSAQRLRRKYGGLLSQPEGSLLEECTRTIVQQVDDMKRLVNEFSNFARLPRAQPSLCDLSEVVEESLALYRPVHPRVSFAVEKDKDFPLLNLDRNQFKQVMINLLDNAVHAFDGKEGEIRIRMSYDAGLRIARVECADTGPGLTAEDKLRVFEPYYSTKEKGTGLGLTIVASIVADHNGFVRVRDNAGSGTVMSIELPIE